MLLVIHSLWYQLSMENLKDKENKLGNKYVILILKITYIIESYQEWKRNKHKQRVNLVLTILIEDLNFVESVSPESARDNHPWYDYVSNLPSFLQNCEGFTRIQTDLKAMMTQEKTPDSDYQEPIPTLEPVCCDECLAWI